MDCLDLQENLAQQVTQVLKETKEKMATQDSLAS